MQRYSGKRELHMELPSDPHKAVEAIIDKLNIPWKDNLEKSVRIFINKQFLDAFIKSGQQLSEDDIIAFIPISGGG
jgi:molybdopterin converting factor small subunit